MENAKQKKQTQTTNNKHQDKTNPPNKNPWGFGKIPNSFFQALHPPGFPLPVPPPGAPGFPHGPPPNPRGITQKIPLVGWLARSLVV